MGFDVNYPLVHFGHFVSPICFFVQPKENLYNIFIYYSGRTTNLLAEYLTVSYETLESIVASFVYSFEKNGSRGHFIFSMGDFQLLSNDEIRQQQEYKLLLSWDDKFPFAYDDLIPLVHCALREILRKACYPLDSCHYQKLRGKQQEYRLR